MFAFVMAENDLTIVIEPGVSLEPSFVTRHADSKRRLGSSPAEEPGKDKGLLEAGGPHEAIAASNLHQPSQAWNRGNQRHGRFPFPLQEHFFREGEEPRERQDSQGEIDQKEKPPGLGKDETFSRRELK